MKLMDVLAVAALAACFGSALAGANSLAVSAGILTLFFVLTSHWF